MDLQVDQADCCGCFRLHSLPENPSPTACSAKPAPIARLTETMFNRSSIQTLGFSSDRKKPLVSLPNLLVQIPSWLHTFPSYF